MKAVTLSVDDEFVAMGDAIGGLIADIKAGKTVLEDLTDAVGKLIPAVQNLQNMGADFKKPDNKAYVVYAIDKAIEA